MTRLQKRRQLKSVFWRPPLFQPSRKRSHVRAVSPRIGGNDDLGVILLFQFHDFLALVVEHVLGDIQRETAIDPDHLLAAGTGMNPGQVEQCLGLHRTDGTAAATMFADAVSARFNRGTEFLARNLQQAEP